MKKSKQIFSSLFSRARLELLIQLSALPTILASFFLALPSLLTPLGLPPEGDAVDYRIPLIRWILRNGEYPNFPWSMVDDYPMLGELLMTPLYAISPSLVRLIPIAAYFGLGYLGAWLAILVEGKKSGYSSLTIGLVGACFALGLRPILLQSNLIMVDNLASAFLLASLVASLRGFLVYAALFCAGALATRYSTWGTAAFVALLIPALFPQNKTRSFLLFCSIASLGALPFLVRNYFVNDGIVFYPIGSEEAMKAVGVSNYGRGTDLKSFLLLPYDLLYTNSYIKGIFDYTLGKYFYLQLFLVLACAPWGIFRITRYLTKTNLILLSFALAHTLIWFFSGQQMRFFVPSLLIINLFMIPLLCVNPLVLSIVSLAGIMSVISVQKDSILMAMGKKPSIFSDKVEAAQKCFSMADVKNDSVAYVDRDGILGFFDRDFTFLSPHPYAVKTDSLAQPKWIYTLHPREGFLPFPPQSPCLLKRED